MNASPDGPATARAVARASARPRSGPVTVADAVELAVSGKGIDEVVTALIRSRRRDSAGRFDDAGKPTSVVGSHDADAKRLAADRCRRSSRHRPRRSRALRSDHDPRSGSSARCAAQPFTSPVGSTPPGIDHGSNQPCERRRAARALLQDVKDLTAGLRRS